jgi:uncharacterized protein YutE (UPF0331/DUF86 family)
MTPELKDKLSLLESYVGEAASLLAKPASTEWDAVIDLALERTVQRLVECAADCGDLWLTSQGKTEGVSAADVFRQLEEAGALDARLGRVLRDSVRTRNRIVHDYDTVSRADMRKAAAALMAALLSFIAKLGSQSNAID